jgi:hypothetical protein
MDNGTVEEADTCERCEERTSDLVFGVCPDCRLKILEDHDEGGYGN